MQVGKNTSDGVEKISPAFHAFVPFDSIFQGTVFDYLSLSRHFDSGEKLNRRLAFLKI